MKNFLIGVALVLALWTIAKAAERVYQPAMVTQIPSPEPLRFTSFEQVISAGNAPNDQAFVAAVGAAPARYEMRVPGAQRIYDCFCVPIDNLGELPAFNTIQVSPHPNIANDLLLNLSSYPGRDGRVRLKIVVIYQ